MTTVRPASAGRTPANAGRARKMGEKRVGPRSVRALNRGPVHRLVERQMSVHDSNQFADCGTPYVATRQAVR